MEMSYETVEMIRKNGNRSENIEFLEKLESATEQQKSEQQRSPAIRLHSQLRLWP